MNHKPIFEKNQDGDIIHFYGWGGECWFEYDGDKVTRKSSTGSSETYYKNRELKGEIAV